MRQQQAAAAAQQQGGSGERRAARSPVKALGDNDDLRVGFAQQEERDEEAGVAGRAAPVVAREDSHSKLSFWAQARNQRATQHASAPVFDSRAHNLRPMTSLRVRASHKHSVRFMRTWRAPTHSGARHDTCMCCMC
jgi:hypothetical protein